MAPARYSLADLFLATAMIAGALALWQLGVRLKGPLAFLVVGAGCAMAGAGVGAIFHAKLRWALIGITIGTVLVGLFLLLLLASL